jgi:hypothetical protein
VDRELDAVRAALVLESKICTPLAIPPGASATQQVKSFTAICMQHQVIWCTKSARTDHLLCPQLLIRTRHTLGEWLALFGAEEVMWYRTLVGVVTQLLQQLTGINAVMYVTSDH